MSLRCAVLMLLAALSAAAAQGDPSPFCAFEVFVKSPSGVPVAGAYVVETEQGGALFDTQNTDEKGVARFCDAPMFGLVSFNVGGKMCGAVSVEYLDPSWFETTQVFITYERCPGVCFSLPGRCLVFAAGPRHEGRSASRSGISNGARRGRPATPARFRQLRPRLPGDPIWRHPARSSLEGRLDAATD